MTREGERKEGRGERESPQRERKGITNSNIKEMSFNCCLTL